jgi:glycosyltransferase involved in cell wall biosynthesis
LHNLDHVRKLNDSEATYFANWSCGNCPTICSCTRSNTKLEVLMFSYNHESSVREAIESVQRQNLPKEKFSIYLHDDYSSDKTAEIAIETLTQSGLRFTVAVRHKNQFSETKFRFFFQTIYQSQSKYVAFLDTDDVWLSRDKLKNQEARMDSDDRIALCHTRYEVLHKETLRITSQPDDTLSTRHLTSSKFLRRENFVGTLTCMIRTSSLIGEVDPVAQIQLPVGDYPIWLQATQGLDRRIAFLNEPTSQYRIHGQNYWATGGLWNRLRRTRRLQRDLTLLNSERIGESIPSFLLKVLARRLVSVTFWTRNSKNF